MLTLIVDHKFKVNSQQFSTLKSLNLCSYLLNIIDFLSNINGIEREPLIYDGLAPLTVKKL